MMSENAVKAFVRKGRFEHVADMGRYIQMLAFSPGLEVVYGFRRKIKGGHLKPPLGEKDGMPAQPATQIQYRLIP
jgi:hypothetical protein